MLSEIEIFDDQIRSVPEPRKSITERFSVLRIHHGVVVSAVAPRSTIAVSEVADAKGRGIHLAQVGSSTCVHVAPRFVYSSVPFGGIDPQTETRAYSARLWQDCRGSIHPESLEVKVIRSVECHVHRGIVLGGPRRLHQSHQKSSVSAPCNIPYSCPDLGNHYSFLGVADLGDCHRGCMVCRKQHSHVRLRCGQLHDLLEQRRALDSCGNMPGYTTSPCAGHALDACQRMQRSVSL